MRKEVLFVVIFAFAFIGLVSATPVSDDIHVNIQTTYSNGSAQVGTFNFVFNISTASNCSPSTVLYSNSASLTTDSNGIISYYLPNVTLPFNEQYWLCYYKGGSLIDSAKLSRSPYAFFAKNVTLSGVEVDTNFNLSGYNISQVNNVNATGNVSAQYFVGNGKYLTGISGSAGNPFNQSLNTTDNVTFANVTANYGFFSYLGSLANKIVNLFVQNLFANNINASGSVNASAFYQNGSPVALNSSLNDYYPNSNPNGYYNSTTLPASASGNPFNQSLNTTDNVTFANITANYGFFSYLGSLANKIVNLFVDTIHANTIYSNIIGNSSTVYYGNGSQLTGVTASANPAGTDTAVQYNNAGSTGGNSSFFYANNTNHTVGINGNLIVNGANWSNGHGAIIASGNNSNGYYVQYADGTMVEWGGVSSTATTSASNIFGTTSGTVYDKSMTWTLPLAFSSADYYTTATTTNGITAVVGSKSTSSATIIVYHPSSAHAVAADVVAIGRWTNLDLGTGSGGNGGIVNTITNGNGTAVEYANGVVDMWTKVSPSITTASSSGSSYAGSYAFNFPVSVVDINDSVILVSAIQSIGRVWPGQISTENNSGANVQIQGSASTAAGYLQLHIIGRWTNSTSVNTPDYSTWGLNSAGTQIVQVNSSKDVNVTGNLYVQGVHITGSGGGGGVAYDQSLNTTDNVTFNHVNVTNGMNVTGDLIVNGANWSNGHGAIIASGNNSNGYYVQYADGTMIEWGSGTKNTTAGISNRLGTTAGTTYYASDSVAFPLNFINVPIVVTSSTTNAVGSRARAQNIDSTGFTAGVESGSLSSYPVSYNWIAIGRWTNLNLGTGSGGSGGIVNTISNANGTCTQWANGIQECYTLMDVNVSAGPYTGGGAGTYYYSSPDPSWTFPSGFVASPQIVVSSQGYPTLARTNVVNAPYTSVSFEVDSLIKNSAIPVNLIAIGRWTNATNVNTPDYSTWGLNSAGTQIVQVNSSKDVNVTGNLISGGLFYVNKTTGKIGIGINSPGEALDVNGNIRATGEFIGTLGTGYGQFRAISGNYGFLIKNDGLTTSFLLTNSGDQYGNANSLVPLSINDSNGYVGIGTTSPNSLLDVEGPSGASSDANYGTISVGNAGNTRWGIVSKGIYNAFEIKDFTDNKIPISIEGNPTNNTLYLKANGNVGIGTTSPTQALDVAGNISVGGASDYNWELGTTTVSGGSWDGNWGFGVQHPGSDYFTYASFYGTGDNTRGFEVINKNGNSVPLFVGGSGNVGIGTTSPSYQLQLSTDSAAKPSTNTWTVASDRRIKTNITYLTNYTENIDWIKNFPNAVTYNYNGLYYPNTGLDYGFIAQDVNAYAPLMITHSNVTLTNGSKINLLSVNTNELDVRMLPAIKGLINQTEEQQKIIEQQNSTIQNLTNTVSQQQSLLNRICSNNPKLCE